MSKQEIKVAIVTGAGGTLCSVMARSLARRKIKVALIGRDMEKLKKTESEILAENGTALSISADVSDQQAIEHARSVVLEKLGIPQILINGAGGHQTDAVTGINEFDRDEVSAFPQVKGFFNLDMKCFKSVLEINTMGTVIPSYVFGADMAKNGGGCIINMASMSSYRPLSRVAAYGMAKAGIANFTQWLAAYLAPANIRVNAIAPGFFLNDGNRNLLLTPDGGFSPRGESIIRQTPMKRFGEACQLTGCMNWLIDEESSGFVTGIVVPVDGGFLACSGV